jgi:hypothetical protein
MGYLMEQANQNYLILEANDCAGSFYQQYPRHGTAIPHPSPGIGI